MGDLINKLSDFVDYITGLWLSKTEASRKREADNYSGFLWLVGALLLVLDIFVKKLWILIVGLVMIAYGIFRCFSGSPIHDKENEIVELLAQGFKNSMKNAGKNAEQKAREFAEADKKQAIKDYREKSAKTKEEKRKEALERKEAAKREAAEAAARAYEMELKTKSLEVAAANAIKQGISLEEFMAQEELKKAELNARLEEQNAKKAEAERLRQAQEAEWQAKLNGTSNAAAQPKPQTAPQMSTQATPQAAPQMSTQATPQAAPQMSTQASPQATPQMNVQTATPEFKRPSGIETVAMINEAAKKSPTGKVDVSEVYKAMASQHANPTYRSPITPLKSETTTPSASTTVSSTPGYSASTVGSTSGYSANTVGSTPGYSASTVGTTPGYSSTSANAAGSVGTGMSVNAGTTGTAGVSSASTPSVGTTPTSTAPASTPAYNSTEPEDQRIVQVQGDKKYYVFDCPGCGQKVRIPNRGKKGRVAIVCPACKTRFVRMRW